MIRYHGDLVYVAQYREKRFQRFHFGMFFFFWGGHLTAHASRTVADVVGMYKRQSKMLDIGRRSLFCSHDI